MLKELLAVFCLLMTKMSSTYLTQSLGGLGEVLMALDSTSSMNRLPTKADNGTHLCPTDPFIIQSVEEKTGVFRQ